MDTQITPERIDALTAYLPLLLELADGGRIPWTQGTPLPGADATFPYPIYPEEVLAFFMEAGRPWWADTGYATKDAGTWIADPAFVAEADLDAVRTMLTWCVRGERFCDGFWTDLVQEGRIIPLLRRLQALRAELWAPTPSAGPSEGADAPRREGPSPLERTLRRRLATLEQRLVEFKPTRVRDLEDATELAWLAFVLEEDEPREEALERLVPLAFEGDHNRWSPIERAKALRAWVAMHDGDRATVGAIREELLAAGVSAGRRKGALLDGPHGRLAQVAKAEEAGRARDLFAWRLLLLQELVFLWTVDARVRGKPSLASRAETCLQALRESLTSPTG